MPSVSNENKTRTLTADVNCSKCQKPIPSGSHMTVGIDPRKPNLGHIAFTPNAESIYYHADC